MSKQFYGQIILTADSREYVVCEKVFSKKGELQAYLLGCRDGIVVADPDNEDLYATASNKPAEDE